MVLHDWVVTISEAKQVLPIYFSKVVSGLDKRMDNEYEHDHHDDRNTLSEFNAKVLGLLPKSYAKYKPQINLEILTARKADSILVCTTTVELIDILIFNMLSLTDNLF